MQSPGAGKFNISNNAPGKVLYIRRYKAKVCCLCGGNKEKETGRHQQADAQGRERGALEEVGEEPSVRSTLNRARCHVCEDNPQ